MGVAALYRHADRRQTRLSLVLRADDSVHQVRSHKAVKGKADLFRIFFGELVKPLVVLHDEDIVVELYILRGVGLFQTRVVPRTTCLR